jgi:hypothetical protein
MFTLDAAGKCRCPLGAGRLGQSVWDAWHKEREEQRAAATTAADAADP